MPPMQGIPRNYWAKFSPSANGCEDDSSYLGLIDHLVDVATCFEILLSNGYDLPLARAAGLQKLTVAQQHRLCFLAFLHDLGKAAVDFQRQIFVGENQKRRHRGHTAICTFFLVGEPNNPTNQAFLRMLPSNHSTWFHHDDDDDGVVTLARMFLATWGHHGRPIDFDFPSRDKKYNDVQWNDWRYADIDSLLREIMTIATHQWPGILEAADPINATCSFMEEFNGILQLADWIASDKRLFAYEKTAAHADRRDFALDASKEFLKKTGRISISRENSFKDAFGFEPNGMQRDFLTISSELIQ
jgi:CRISPR-associated endonuclease/helicase Cas3